MPLVDTGGVAAPQGVGNDDVTLSGRNPDDGTHQTTRSHMVFRIGTLTQRVAGGMTRRRAVLLGLGLAALATGIAPIPALAFIPGVIPVVAALTCLQLAMRRPWYRIDSPSVPAEAAQRIRRITRDLCESIGCAEPRLYVDLTAIPNAAATSLGGRGKMVVNTGLLALMDDRQAKAVIGHELGHIRERHLLVLRVMTLPLLFVDLDRIVGGALAAVHLSANIGLALPMLIWGGAFSVINGTMRLAERSADRYSGRATRDPLAMADALATLRDSRPVAAPTGDPAVPLHGAKRALAVTARYTLVPAVFVVAKVLGFMLNTHPPLAKRIRWMQAAAVRGADVSDRAHDATTASPEPAPVITVPGDGPATPQPTVSVTGRVVAPVRQPAARQCGSAETPQPTATPGPTKPTQTLQRGAGLDV